MLDFQGAFGGPFCTFPQMAATAKSFCLLSAEKQRGLLGMLPSSPVGECYFCKWRLALFGKAARLFCNQFGVVEVVDFHGTAHIGQRVGRYGAGIFATLAQHVVDGRDVFLKLLATGADGVESLVENLFKEFLTLHIAQSTAAIVVLQLFEVGIVRPVALKVLGATESIEIGKHGVTLNVAGVGYVDVQGVSVH